MHFRNKHILKIDCTSRSFLDSSSLNILHVKFLFWLYFCYVREKLLLIKNTMFEYVTNKQTPNAKFFKLILLHLSLRIPPFLFQKINARAKKHKNAPSWTTTFGFFWKLKLSCFIVITPMIMRPVNIRIDIACLKSINRIMKK